MTKTAKKKIKKQVIESGLIGSMVGMVGTGFSGQKNAHIISSALFVGFTLWHYLQYRSVFRSKMREKMSKSNLSNPRNSLVT